MAASRRSVQHRSDSLRATRNWYEHLIPVSVHPLELCSLFTGKTLFLCYLLIRLLRMKQPVLLYLTSTTSLLFWNRKVYTSPTDKVHLPTPLDNSTLFIWSLFDVKGREEPPDIATYMRCFPVQAPSPSDSRHTIWRKEQGPLFAVFPLWTRKELTIT